MLQFIVWNVSPEIFTIGPISPRWYGLLFASGFLIGYFLVARMFRREGLPETWLDSLLTHLMVGTVIGARLGHVIFYDWDYYSRHLVEILYVWQGGLASHGGFIGNVIALWIFSKRVAKKPFLFVVDRIAAPIGIAGMCIRLGNLMNSEIVGQPTDAPWGFVFKQLGEDFARHPSQLYEAIAYLLTFVFLFWLYWKTDARLRTGLLAGWMFTLIFAFRILIEFVKENQEAFEDGLPLNMGQILSIPIVAVGIFLIVRAYTQPPVPAQEPKAKTQKA